MIVDPSDFALWESLDLAELARRYDSAREEVRRIDEELKAAADRKQAINVVFLRRLRAEVGDYKAFPVDGISWRVTRDGRGLERIVMAVPHPRKPGPAEGRPET